MQESSELKQKIRIFVGFFQLSYCCEWDRNGHL